MGTSCDIVHATQSLPCTVRQTYVNHMVLTSMPQPHQSDGPQWGCRNEAALEKDSMSRRPRIKWLPNRPYMTTVSPFYQHAVRRYSSRGNQTAAHVILQFHWS